GVGERVVAVEGAGVVEDVAAGDGGGVEVDRAGCAAGRGAGEPVGRVVAVAAAADAREGRAGAGGSGRPRGRVVVVDAVDRDVGERLTGDRHGGLGERDALAAVGQHVGA